LPPTSNPWKPPAHTSVPGSADTPFSAFSEGCGEGLGTTLQDRPFQWRTIVNQSPPFPSWKPTAHASFGASTSTAFRSSKKFPGSGLGTTRHFRPVHRAVSVPWLPSPTAHTFRLDEAETPLNDDVNPSDGLGITAHAEPLQWRDRVSLPSSPTDQTSLVVIASTARREL
jgi:hypothetical protein